ncbi:hypothetical protein CTI12_AA161890 [Artemisia annua]|uniref:Trafficking protein particle complex subunit 2-like protein n=1 Tax=Artemisia annua TaxID=35608 RepID=A0A2U1PDW2_ARTAN|nr:hypothetical protein CTI12_AA161890 [Artemisia annua]
MVRCHKHNHEGMDGKTLGFFNFGFIGRKPEVGDILRQFLWKLTLILYQSPYCKLYSRLLNNPLYIQSFTEGDDALKLHHIVHCSLDVVDERVNNPKKSGPMLNETFLGLLYPTENYKVYGYLTNTKVKFILVTTDLDVRDADVRNVSTYSTQELSICCFYEHADIYFTSTRNGLKFSFALG